MEAMILFLLLPVFFVGMTVTVVFIQDFILIRAIRGLISQGNQSDTGKS
jgi:hypothetical protein